MTSVVELVGSARAILALFSLNIDLTKPTHYFMHIAILGSQTDSSSFYDNLLVP